MAEGYQNRASASMLGILGLHSRKTAWALSPVPCCPTDVQSLVSHGLKCLHGVRCRL